MLFTLQRYSIIMNYAIVFEIFLLKMYCASGV